MVVDVLEFFPGWRDWGGRVGGRGLGEWRPLRSLSESCDFTLNAIFGRVQFHILGACLSGGFWQISPANFLEKDHCTPVSK